VTGIGVTPKRQYGIVLQGEQRVATAPNSSLFEQRSLQGVRLVEADSPEPAVLNLHTESLGGDAVAANCMTAHFLRCAPTSGLAQRDAIPPNNVR
jgi:hypothetical protein